MSKKSRRLIWLGGIPLVVGLAGFTLLELHQRPRFVAECDPVDMDVSLRFALSTISDDVAAAGVSLPPEFPAITTRDMDPLVGDHNPDVLEIVRARSGLDENAGPHAVASFDGERVALETALPDLGIDELVLVYNVGSEARGWVLGRVHRVDDRTVELTTDGIANGYHRLGLPFPWEGELMRVSVVRYFTRADLFYLPELPEVAIRPLVRLENFDSAHTMVCLEDFQVVYLVGQEAPREIDDPPSISAPVALDELPRGLRISVRGLRQALHYDGYLRVVWSNSVTLR